MQSRHWKWHLDEVFVKINGERHHLWRAVDHEGEVLESYVIKKRDKKAALKLMQKAIRRYGSPNEIVTDKLRSYSATAKELGCSNKQVTMRWANNRVENSYLQYRRRERAMMLEELCLKSLCNEMNATIFSLWLFLRYCLISQNYEKKMD